MLPFPFTNSAIFLSSLVHTDCFPLPLTGTLWSPLTCKCEWIVSTSQSSFFRPHHAADSLPFGYHLRHAFLYNHTKSSPTCCMPQSVHVCATTVCPFTRSNLCHWACNFSHHHQHTSLSSRHHHDYPARHSPQADKPHLPVPPPLISTINNVEISHFSHLLMLWWDEHSEFALLHKMNLHHIRFICEKSWTPLLLPLPPLFRHPSIRPACWRAWMSWMSGVVGVSYLRCVLQVISNFLGLFIDNWMTTLDTGIEPRTSQR